jgi:hypothetical protein
MIRDGARPRQLNRSVEQSKNWFAKNTMRLRLVWVAFAAAIIVAVSACQRKGGAPQSVTPPLPDVTFCNVVTKLDAFEGKLVRLHATLVRESMHGAVIGGDGKCSTRDNITWPELSEEQWAEVERSAHADAYDVVAVGKFSRIVPSGESDLWADQASIQFDVSSLESIKPQF